MFLKDLIQPIDDTVEITATLQEVIDKMSFDRFHHVIIIDQNKPIGIITEQDIVRCFSQRVDFKSYAIEFARKDLIVLHHTRLVEYALSMMLNNNIRKMIVVDNEENYLGCMEQEDLIYCLEEKIEGRSLKLQQLTHPGNKAVLINENSTIKYALDIMTANKLSSLLITSNDKAIGIISESDIIRLAQQNTDQNEMVKHFMHSPIIQIEEYKTADDMIKLMQKNKIRRVVVFNSKDEYYYTLSSKDVAAIIRGNYTKFLESKFVDARDTFNALSEYVIELIDIDNEQVIFWTNSITKANFDIHLDDCITKLINKDQWKKLYETLLATYILYDTVEIQGRYYQIKGHYGTMTDDNVIKLFLNDITEIMQLTQQLKKDNEQREKLLFDQAKLASMGEMIGNIAHQWRQPLSVISTIASGISFKKEYGSLADEEIIPNMEKIVEQANYLSQTIDDFRNFIKGGDTKTFLNISLLFEKTISIVRPNLKSNYIEIVSSINNELSISGYANELMQAFINIINNSKDALVENKELGDKYIFIEAKLVNDKCEIIIKDNGGGIMQSAINRIFEPYFTTKHQSQGTGLGLSMTYKIITDKHKGTITASNVSYKYNGKEYTGACFKTIISIDAN